MMCQPERQGETPPRQARPVDPLETLLALQNIERTIDGHLQAQGAFIDYRTRLFLSRIRDAAQLAATRSISGRPVDLAGN